MAHQVNVYFSDELYDLAIGASAGSKSLPAWVRSLVEAELGGADDRMRQIDEGLAELEAQQTELVMRLSALETTGDGRQ